MSALRGFVAAGALALALVVPARAVGQAKVGPASDGQPGLHRVGIPEPAAPNAMGSLAYGLTEAQADAPGAHQRLSLRLGGAAPVLPWLNVAPALDGRFDWHSHDSGAVLGGRLAARAFTGSNQLRLGAELTGWVPGAEEFSTVLRSASLDARALVAVRFAHGFLAFNAGYRFDRSANAGANAALLSANDRLALELSEFDAVLLGIGGGVTAPGVELFAEATCDWLVGSGAPSFAESPLRLAAGARRPFSEALSAAVVLEGGLSARPHGGSTGPLIPIEPRATLWVGASYRFGVSRRPLPTTENTPPASPAPAPKPLPAAAPPQAAAPAVALTILDDTGSEVPGARVHLSFAGGERDVELDAAGHAEERLPPGAAKVAVTAPGFESAERSLELVSGAAADVRIELKALPPPSQVRGTVRSFGGTGLAAKIRIEPLGVEATTREDGRFEVDVPPGSYEVVIEANGYQPQRRKITVDAKGVVILNADLQKKR